MNVTYHPVGVIHSPFTVLSQMPIQPTGAASAPGTVELLPEYIEGLKDLDGFSHIILIYHLHQARRGPLTVTPFMDSVPRGIFATRAPSRPNPIGLSIVRLLKIEGCTLYIEALDILDGTPLLDIKPYVPAFDGHPEAVAGWLEGAQARLRSTQSDGRFEGG